MNWQPHHDEFIRTCLRQGMSASGTAAAFSASFHIHVSRNAVIGRAHRKNMERNRSNDPALRDVRTAKQPRAKPWLAAGKSKSTFHRHKRIAEGRMPAPIEKPRIKPDLSALRCVEVDPLHVGLLDLTAEQCRWPYGDRAPFTFCARPAAFGSYCGAHYALSCGTGTPSERSADRVSTRVA